MSEEKAGFPFSHMELAVNKFFIDRAEYLAHLNKSIEFCHKLLVYGHRRVGKSSLISEAIRQYSKNNKKHLFIQLDLSTCSNATRFISQLCLQVDELIKSKEPLKARFEQVYNLIKSIKPGASFNSLTGEVEYSINFTGSSSDVPDSLDEVLDLLEQLSKEHPITVVLDEFQSVTDWDNSEQIQWLIRSRMQRQKNIGYIFSGSSKTLITKLFYEAKSALYKSCTILEVDNYLDSLTLSNWIAERFASINIEINGEVIKEIIQLFRSHPYYTQKICYILCLLNFDKKQTISLEDLRTALGYVLKSESSIYKERLDRLTKNQKKTIYALAQLGPEGKIYSKDAKNKFSLPIAGSIQKTLAVMEKELSPLILKKHEGYIIEDPFFELWLKTI